MQDPRLFALKLKAERDPGLSDGAFRLLARVISDRYLDRTFAADEDFPLPWSWCAVLCRIGENQVYRRIRELETRGYLFNRGLKGCPPTSRFAFVLPESNSPKKGGIESLQKGGIKSRQKGGHLKYIPYGNKGTRKEGGKGGVQARCARKVEPNGNDIPADRVIAAMREAAR